ncbi:hypothetical protein D9Q98_006470 [Chlorella vulgaris]|uniref:Uncharacterized protein n=1 Tax=Chlorella vulgaris TaxID=3077 RepID=A0A9D4TKC4_CHLVU|nr:hypothetical protein D9Q98_006470 [Chlorella vulgaris]
MMSFNSLPLPLQERIIFLVPAADRHWLAPVCKYWEEVTRSLQTRLVLDFSHEPCSQVQHRAASRAAQRECRLSRAALLRGVLRRQEQLTEVTAVNLAHCFPHLQLVEQVSALLRGQISTLHVGMAAHRPQGHTPHTHHSLELLLQCRFVAHHSELRSLVLTNLSSCPPLGQLTALEQLALRGCGSQATPLDQLDISDLTKLRHIGFYDCVVSRHLLDMLPLLPELRELDYCRSSCVQGPSTGWLQGLNRLTRLNFSGRAMSGGEPSVDHVMEALLPLTQLQELSLQASGLRKVPAQVAALPHLHTLSLAFNDVADLIPGPYLSLQLRSLDVYCTDITKLPTSLLPQLTRLCIGPVAHHSSDVEDIQSWVRSLARLKQLQQLETTAQHGSAVMQQLREGLPGVEVKRYRE